MVSRVVTQLDCPHIELYFRKGVRCIPSHRPTRVRASRRRRRRRSPHVAHPGQAVHSGRVPTHGQAPREPHHQQHLSGVLSRRGRPANARGRRGKGLSRVPGAGGRACDHALCHGGQGDAAADQAQHHAAHQRRRPRRPPGVVPLTHERRRLTQGRDARASSAAAAAGARVRQAAALVALARLRQQRLPQPRGQEGAAAHAGLAAAAAALSCGARAVDGGAAGGAQRGAERQVALLHGRRRHWQVLPAAPDHAAHARRDDLRHRVHRCRRLPDRRHDHPLLGRGRRRRPLGG
eukprot:scaffold19799_cov69-Phaeocystis_antarctica.AAC.3